MQRCFLHLLFGGGQKLFPDRCLGALPLCLPHQNISSAGQELKLWRCLGAFHDELFNQLNQSIALINVADRINALASITTLMSTSSIASSNPGLHTPMTEYNLAYLALSMLEAKPYETSASLEIIIPPDPLSILYRWYQASHSHLWKMM